VVVVASTLLSWLLGFQEMGGKVVGEVPVGLPSVSIPVFRWDLIVALLPKAFAISLVGFVEAISIAKAMAARTRDRIDPNQELIGQGLANIVGSFTQAYPASGSFSRSAANLDAGARSGMASVFTGLVVMVTLLFLTPILFHLPEAVLAAIIMMAVIGLIDFRAVGNAWAASKHDGVAATITFVATLGFAPHLEYGIMIGGGLAVGLYLYRSMTPRVAHLGRFEDGTLRDMAVHPHLPTDERIVVVRFDGSLYFANVSYFEEAVLAAIADKPDADYVLVVGDGINQLDASGEEVLRHLNLRLECSGITLVTSGLKRQVLDVMRRTGLFDQMGDDNIFATEDMAIADIYERMGEADELRPLLRNGQG